MFPYNSPQQKLVVVAEYGGRSLPVACVFFARQTREILVRHSLWHLGITENDWLIKLTLKNLKFFRSQLQQDGYCSVGKL